MLAFVDSHNPNLTQKLRYPILEKSNNKLILANHSLKQLNIINDNNHSGKFSSVIQLLNKCESPMGKRKFDYILLNPIKNTETVL